VFDGPEGEPIPGTVVDLDPALTAEALRLLDEVEGSVEGLFLRVIVLTTAGDRAWSYQWGRSVAGMERIDRWEGRPEA
jgi:hypothetical protein